MKKLIFFLFALLLGLQGRCQQHYSYNMPFGTIAGVDGISTTSGESLYYYRPEGCYVKQARIYWGTDTPPTQYSFDLNPNGFDTEGTYQLTGLSSGTKYYVLFSITNCIGTYEDPVPYEFTTISTGTLPTVTTTTATSITTASASSGGNVTSDGGETVTERGVYYSTSTPPTSGTSDGSGTGTYTSSLTSLSANTDYYYRAYAINTYGTGLGEIKTFTTLNPDGDPYVTTTSASSITTTSAISGGNVLYDGGATLTERGVCYSTSVNPTINSSKVTSGSGFGVYTTTLSSLTANTTYYYIAYAKNSDNEVGYGSEYSFTTLDANQAPTVVTDAATSILAHGFTLNGNVTNQGSSVVTTRGFVYSSTDATPMISETGVTNVTAGSGTGAYLFDVTGLYCGTTYYVSAYAINSSGTSYGSVIQVITSSESLSNFQINQYMSNSCRTITAIDQNSAEQLCMYWGETGCGTVTYSSRTYKISSFEVGSHVDQYNVCLKTNDTRWGFVYWPYPTKYIVHMLNGVIVYKALCN